jgi:hypothetical protein
MRLNGSRKLRAANQPLSPGVSGLSCGPSVKRWYQLSRQVVQGTVAGLTIEESPASVSSRPGPGWGAGLDVPDCGSGASGREDASTGCSNGMARSEGANRSKAS